MTTATLEQLPDPDDEKQIDAEYNRAIVNDLATRRASQRLDPNDVPEAETVLQPSLHSAREYLDLLFSEAVSREIDVSDLQEELASSSYDDDHPDNDIGEITDEVLDVIRDAGYTVLENNDSLLIYGLGVEVPE